MIDINIRGLTDVAQLGFPYLKATPGACLVNLCSSSSIHGIPSLAVYSASKFYVNALTQALHIEWEEHGIRVTCVKPGIVNTKMGKDVVTNAATRTDVTLSPEQIAGAIYRAVGGLRVSYVVGRLVQAWAVIDKFLPEYLRIKMTRRLVSGK
jgi:short-subunit dehydrogenase